MSLSCLRYERRLCMKNISRLEDKLKDKDFACKLHDIRENVKHLSTRFMNRLFVYLGRLLYNICNSVQAT